MAGDLEIVLRSPVGEYELAIDTIISASYGRAHGVIGSFSLGVAEGVYNPDLFKVDSRIEFWRQVSPGRRVLDTDTAFFLRRRTPKRDSDGAIHTMYSGPSAIDLLRRRIVAYAAGTDPAITQNDPADNAMKVIVRQNLGTLGNPAARQLSTDFFTIAADESLGPTMSKRYAWRNLLDLIKEISDDTLTTGNPIFFDVVRTTDSAFEFRTYKGQRGTDRTEGSSAPTLFSTRAKNLAEEELDENYEEEITDTYAGGQGEGSDRLIGTASDATRSGRSPFGRRESFRDATQATKIAELQADARTALGEGRPRRTIAATLASTPETVYGRDWAFGDKVTVEVFGVQMDAWINSVSFSLNSSGEQTVTAKVEGTDFSA